MAPTSERESPVPKRSSSSTRGRGRGKVAKSAPTTRAVPSQKPTTPTRTRSSTARDVVQIVHVSDTPDTDLLKKKETTQVAKVPETKKAVSQISSISKVETVSRIHLRRSYVPNKRCNNSPNLRGNPGTMHWLISGLQKPKSCFRRREKHSMSEYDV